MFQSHLDRWGLIADGQPITTPAAQLLSVLRDGEPAMLKLSHEADERLGGVLLEWWNGGMVRARRVFFAQDGGALLLKRANGAASLADMACSGQDDEACRILCAAAAKLHAARARPLPELIPLKQWFQDLEPAAITHGGVLKRSLEAACFLLEDPREGGCYMATFTTATCLISGNGADCRACRSRTGPMIGAADLCGRQLLARG